jgi:hypothetical protein
VAHELDDLDRDPSPADLPMAAALRRPPRRDGVALGFGVAFIAFGLLGVLRASGAPLPSAWLYPIILIGLGAAGLVSSLMRERRG